MHVDNQCIQVYLADTSSFILRVGGKGGRDFGYILKLIIWLFDNSNYKIKEPH
jgi:hypothetical protein